MSKIGSKSKIDGSPSYQKLDSAKGNLKGRDYDDLTITPTNPTVKYVNQFVTTTITGFHDKSSFLSHRSNRQEDKNSEIYGEVLTEDQLKEKIHSSREVERKGQGIKRIGAPHLTNDQTPKKSQAFHISFSLLNNPDYKSELKTSDLLRKHLSDSSQLPQEKIDQHLTTSHIFLKNGYNGARYKDGQTGATITVENSHCGSWDRDSSGIQMSRAIFAGDPSNGKKTPTICYTGRPDTYSKAFEQAKMIFFTETLDGGNNHHKGLSHAQNRDGTPEKTPDGKPVFLLRYAVNSMQSTSPLYALGGENECEYLENEQKALQKLRDQGIHQIPNPKNPKEMISVRFQPILFSRQVNIFSNLEKLLPSWISGSKHSLDITRNGWQELKGLAEEKKTELQIKISQLQKQKETATGASKERIEKQLETLETDAKLIIELVDQLDQSFNRTLGFQLSPGEELLCRDMLCKLIQLPLIYHCKSSTDRTSVGVAMSCTLHQWRSMGMPIPPRFTELLKNEDFKELFLANWAAGHQISRNARAAYGVLETKNGDEITKTEVRDREALGLAVGTSLMQCSMLPQLLPQRILKPYGLFNGLKDTVIPKASMTHRLWKKPVPVIAKLVLAPLTVGIDLAIATVAIGSLFAIGVSTGLISSFKAPFGTLSPPKSLAGKIMLGAPMVLGMFIWNTLHPIFGLFRTFPKQVINLEDESMAKTRFLASSPTEKAYNKAFGFFPYQAKSKDEYHKFYRETFIHPTRPPREILPPIDLIAQVKDAPTQDHFEEGVTVRIGKDIYSYESLREKLKRYKLDDEKIERALAACRTTTFDIPKNISRKRLTSDHVERLTPEMGESLNIEIIPATKDKPWTIRGTRSIKIVDSNNNAAYQLEDTTLINLNTGHAHIEWRHIPSN